MIYEALIQLFPDYKEGDWVIQDDSDGNGPYIKEWNRVETQPTPEELNAVVIKQAVPKVVTMRQARLALLGSGVLANVDAAIEALPSPQKEQAKIEWDYSSEVFRDKALVKLMTPALGLTEDQVAQLFITAATL